MTTAHINRIATSVPPHDVHRAFIDFAESLLPEGTMRNLFRRMVRMSAIEHRYSFIHPTAAENGEWSDAEGLYVPGAFSPARRAAWRPLNILRRTDTMRTGQAGAERRRAARHYACDRDLVHRPLCAGPGFRCGRASGPQPLSGTHGDRLHGLLRGHQRAEDGAPHRSLGGTGQGSDFESGAVHAAHAGDAGIWSRFSPSCCLRMDAPRAW